MKIEINLKSLAFLDFSAYSQSSGNIIDIRLKKMLKALENIMRTIHLKCVNKIHIRMI